MTADGNRPAVSATDLRGKIRSFVFSRFPLARTRNLADDAALLQDGVVDSLGILDIVAYLEEAFPIRIGDEELNPDNFGSIQALSRFVEGKMR